MEKETIVQPMILSKLLKPLCSSFIFFILLFLCAIAPVFAAQTINSVTLNGAGSVTVAPSDSITAAVNVTLTGGSNWRSTSWDISGINCVDHANHETNGTYDESFTVIAPDSPGTYSISFVARGSNSCRGGSSNTYTMNSAITVSSPTSTPTPTPTNTPTPTPPPGATNTPTPPPGSTATPTPTSTTSSSSTSAVTYYPSVSLNAYSPNPTINTSLSYTGTVSIESGSVKAVEYSITSGAEWLSASLSNGSFSFTTPSLSEGSHTILVRALSQAEIYTQTGSYASDAVTIITTPPQVTLNEFEQSPTNDTSPTISGTASSPRGIVTRVEVSLDEGTTWLPASFSSGTFTFTTEPLEDNNYPVSVRAFDNAGNMTLSSVQTLVIDTLPPIIGGGIQTVGPQILSPNSDGVMTVVAGAKTTVAMSMKGGVTDAEILLDDGSFPLALQKGTNRWIGTVDFQTAGDKQLIISAVDGAGNETTRPFSMTHVEPFGTITDIQTNTPVLDASITLYVFETITRQWIAWDGTSYGQQNPQQIADGTYSFLVPAGTYYLDVAAAGYHAVQSEELTVLEPSIINGVLPVRPAPAIRFTVPVFGRLVLSIPSFLLPPDTVSSDVFYAGKTPATPPVNTIINTPVPDFSLPDLSGETVSPGQFIGKRWVLSFLAPWSPPSQEQAPLLAKLSQQLSGNQAALSVSLQETTATTQTFLKKGGYSFPTVIDTNGETGALFNVSMLPYHVFIDSAGIIRETHTGVLTDEELLEKLSQLP